jgi:anti-sigma factor RsiW
MFVSPTTSSPDCNADALSAYLDRELDPAARAALEHHLDACASCRGDLDGLREVSQAFAAYPYADLTPAERSAVHAVLAAAMESDGDAPLLRLGGMMGLIAASVLVVSAAWLVALPPARSAAHGTRVAAAAPPAEWERIAMTLHVDAPHAVDDQVDLADANLDEWMLNSLERGEQP